MIPDKLKKRLVKERPMTSITVRMPVDVVDTLKAMAPRKGLAGYQALLKAYVGEGLRRDEALLEDRSADRLVAVLKKRGVDARLIDDAVREVSAGYDAKVR